MSNLDFKINLAHALSGAGGGMISMALTYPLITVSSRLQVQKDSKGPGAYKGSRDAIIKILMNEGVSGLYSGLGSAIFGIAITNGVYYYFYELTKSKIINPSEFIGDISVKQSMIASSIAGAATVLITNPIWVVNTRVTTRKETLDESTITTSSTPSITTKTTKKPIKKKIGTLETIINIFDNDGISAFWQGVTPALILVINPIIQYTAFEQLKSRLEKIKTLKNLDFFILGAISKLVATTLTYPYIVMKSRMQLRQTSKGNGRYHSVLDGIKKIIESEGIKGLYKGISSKLLQSVLNAAFLFMFKKALFEKALWLIVYYQRILNIKKKI